MCNNFYNQRLAPLDQKHLNEIKRIYPEQAVFAEKLYRVLTTNLCPQVNLLVSFVVLKDLYDQGKSGIFGSFGRVIYAPLSIVAKTGEHEWTRFRPQPVNELHTSFLSFMMAKPNRISLNRLLGQYGLCFSQGHCCGILFGNTADVARYERSKLFKARNLMRSYAESMAMPVQEVAFEQIPAVTSDLGEVECIFYKKYEEVFEKMSRRRKNEFIDSSKEHLWGEIISKVVAPSVSPSSDPIRSEAPRAFAHR